MPCLSAGQKLKDMIKGLLVVQQVGGADVSSSATSLLVRRRYGTGRFWKSAGMVYGMQVPGQ